MNYSNFRDILLEYTFKDVNAVFGKFFDKELGRLTANNAYVPSRFSRLYDDFENYLDNFKFKFNLIGSDIFRIPAMIIMNSYSKLKKVLENDDIDDYRKAYYIRKFLEHIPYIVFIVSYFKKFPERFYVFSREYSSSREYGKQVVDLIKNYESMTLFEIIDIIKKYNLEKEYETIVTDYILLTYARSRISPIYEDAEVVIYKPKNWIESRILAADTEWCISSSHAKEHFEEYYRTQQYDIYFIFLKDKGPKGKFAFILDRTDNRFYVDVKDINFVLDEKERDTLFKMLKSTFIIRNVIFDSYMDTEDRIFHQNLQMLRTVLYSFLNKSKPANSVPFSKNITDEYLDKVRKTLVFSLERPSSLLRDIVEISSNNAELFTSVIIKYLDFETEPDKGMELLRIAFDLLKVYYNYDETILLKLMNDPKYYRRVLKLFLNKENIDDEFDSYVELYFLRMYSYIKNVNFRDVFESDDIDFLVKDYKDVTINISNVLPYLLRLEHADERAYKFANFYLNIENMKGKMNTLIKTAIKNYEITSNNLDGVKFKSAEEVKKMYVLGRKRIGSFNDPIYYYKFDNFPDDLLIPGSLWKDAEEIINSSNSPFEFFVNIVDFNYRERVFEIAKQLIRYFKKNYDLSMIKDMLSKAENHHLMSLKFFRDLYDVMKKEIY